MTRETMIGPDATDVAGCQMLFTSVLVECINVALGHGWEASEADIVEAQNWIGSDDFAMICECVGVAPELVVAHFEVCRDRGLAFEVEVWA